MKKKIYFIVSSFIQVIIAIYSMISADKIIKTLIDATSMYPEDMRERITSLFQNSGTAYVFVLASIAIILNVLIGYFALSDKLASKKKGIIACSIGLLFTSVYSTSQLLAILNIILISTIKGEELANKKKMMPVIEKEKVNKKKIILAIFLFMAYFSQFILEKIVPDNDVYETIVSIGFYLTMAILAIIFFYDLLSENFIIFKKNFKAYFSNLIGKVGKFYLAYVVIAVIVALITKAGTSVNQKNVEALPVFILVPLAIIYAPLVEETLFRGCIRRFIKNDKVFIVISAISFGLMHTIFTEPNLYNAIMLGIPYMAIGGFLAYLYTKTNNILTNITFHAFHNTLAVILSILINGI